MRIQCMLLDSRIIDVCNVDGSSQTMVMSFQSCKHEYKEELKQALKIDMLYSDGNIKYYKTNRMRRMIRHSYLDNCRQTGYIIFFEPCVICESHCIYNDVVLKYSCYNTIVENIDDLSIFRRFLFHDELIQAAAHPKRVQYSMDQCEDPEEYFNNI